MKPNCLRPLRVAGPSAIVLLVSAAFFGCGGGMNSGSGPGPMSQGIRGTVVDHATGQPVGAAIVVLEQPDPMGIDRIVATTTASSDGSFFFPGPNLGIFDLVADASVPSPSGATNTYAATITFRVPAATAVGKIPLVPEFGDAIPTGQPVNIDAVVTTSSSTAPPPEVDIKLAALQAATVDDGTRISVTIPAFAGSTPEGTTIASQSCSSGATCFDYKLLIPASNPVTGTFHFGGTTYSIPGSPQEVIFEIESRAFVHGSANSSDCAPPRQTSAPVIPRGTLPSTIPNFAFAGCQ